LCILALFTFFPFIEKFLGASDTVSRISVSDTDSVEEKASIPSESDSGVVVCGTSFGENCSSSKNGHAASALYRNCGQWCLLSLFILLPADFGKSAVIYHLRLFDNNLS
jgi:hypothetical protein